MKSKKESRIRRAAKVRRKIRELAVPRLCVHRTPKHIYAQLISADGTITIASASTLHKFIREDKKAGTGVEAATFVGKEIAKQAKKIGIEKIAFDRSGFKYHGRVKALAEGAREAGLVF